MGDSRWRYDPAWRDFESSEPIPVKSLGCAVDIWVDLEADIDCPTPGQWSALEGFAAMPPEQCRGELMRGFKELGDRAVHREEGDDLAVLAHHTAARLEFGDALTGCLDIDLLIVPKQANSPCPFVLLTIDVGSQSQVWELEALFADNRLLFIDEFSGLHARLEWKWFNSAQFNPNEADHPYWRFCVIANRVHYLPGAFEALRRPDLSEDRSRG